MTDETKRIFDAPWKAVNDGKTTWDNSVQTISGYMIACGCFLAESNRLASLPELYDALVDVLYEDCHVCLESYIDRCEIPNLAFMLENGCPKNDKACFYQKYWKLLKKVRDGK